jgi:hypothetical protein
MKRLAILPVFIAVSLPVVLVTTLSGERPVQAEPAWGGNCLACHDLMLDNLIEFVDADGMVDPDESGTGAPDRGLRPFFKAYRGGTTTLQIDLSGFVPDDTYAVEIRRLKFPGVEQGGQLSYSGDCDWAQWSETASYFTDPHVTYKWGAGPTLFEFDLNVNADADVDYYNIIFAVAGRLTGSQELYYAQEHFYVQVLLQPGDTNCDGALTFKDINPFILALSDPVGYQQAFPDCDIMTADCNLDGLVDFRDINPFVALLSG